MDLGLAGRRVIVTGGTSGIGLAVARLFAGEQAKVALTYRNQREAAERLAAEFGGPGQAMALRCALDEPGSAEQAVAAADRAWGGLDVVVANAFCRGPRRPPGMPAESVSPGAWRGLVQANLCETMATVLTALPGMRERHWGRVVLISSHIAHDGAPGQEFYGAAKAALHGFARSLAWDTGPDGVLVNVVCPGLTATEGVLTDLPPAIRERETTRTATGQLSTPADVAAAVVFLCSEANGNISGEALTVAGGR
ncbi:MAG TPA: SDR family oxidoreductase [Streptosporangiaceae bacterium]|nr:SDR family oxidoreductase [Streptosporangiaceae bacterium]